MHSRVYFDIIMGLVISENIVHFIITLAHMHPQGERESRRSSLQHKNNFYFRGPFPPPPNWGLFLNVKGLFSPFFGREGFVVLFALFLEAIFSMWDGAFFSLCGKFFRLVLTYKNFWGRPCFGC